MRVNYGQTVHGQAEIDAVRIAFYRQATGAGHHRRQRLGAAARTYHRDRLDIEPYVDALVGTWKAALGTGDRP